MYRILTKFKSTTKFGALLAIITSGWPMLSEAYTVPSKYQGSCPSGYFSVVTEPVDASTNYTGKVTEHALPPNICVQRLPDRSSTEDENFSKYDFIKIKGRLLDPFPGVKYDWNNYEAIVGHYKNGGTYFGSYYANDPKNPNFTGAHPILIGKNANATIRYVQKDNIYLIDKQQKIVRTKAYRCPSDASTVGESKSCYSKLNGLLLNNMQHLELIELSKLSDSKIYVNGQDCPLGLGMAIGLGSSRGICTSIESMHQSQIARSELWSPLYFDNISCPKNQVSFDGVTCMPSIVAFYCTMDNAALRSFKFAYQIGRHVYFWPWQLVNTSNGNHIDMYDHLYWASTGSVPSAAVKKDMSLFSTDQDFIQPADYDGDTFPVIHLFSHLTCDKFQDNGGWSQEPFPTAW